MIGLFVRRTNGKGQKLSMQATDCLIDLQREVRRILGLEKSRENHDSGVRGSFMLYHRGKKLEESSDETLEDSGIDANSIIHVVESAGQSEEDSSTMQFRFIVEKKMLTYEVERSKSIASVKTTICEDLEIDEDDLTLSYLGVELQAEKTIAEYEFPPNVLVSALAPTNLQLEGKKAYLVSRGEPSEDNEQANAGHSKMGHLTRRLQKSQSYNKDNSLEFKSSNMNFHSMKLNKIDESRNESQLNESEDISEEIEERIEGNNDFDMFDEFNKQPWYDQRIVETESIEDENSRNEDVYKECLLELTRVDSLRQYVLQCNKRETFVDAVKTLAKLEKVPEKRVKLLMKWDETGGSGVFNPSMGDLSKSPKMIQDSPRRKRSSISLSRIEASHARAKIDGSMKMCVVEKAVLLKSQVVSIEYEILPSQ